MGDRKSSQQGRTPASETAKKSGVSIESDGAIEDSELRKVTGGAGSDTNPVESVSLNFGHVKQS